MEDTRNVIDEYKGVPLEQIVADLDGKGTGLEIALENIEHDFNIGSIVRTANAFGARTVHIIGRRQWNKRGAMATNKYLHVVHHPTTDEFLEAAKEKAIVAVDNVPGSVPLHSVKLPINSILLFGSEGPGISEELRQKAHRIVDIEQFGSTRSMNVGHAAAVAMYEWLRQNFLESKI